MNFERILVVKLADIGDAVLALPAIQALRETYPGSRIDVLTTPAGAQVFQLSPAIDQIRTLAKQRFDHVRGLVSPRGLADLARLTFQLRRARYDAVVILHHLTTAFGTRKYRALARSTGTPVVAGLDNGRGDFLTHSATDFGFGALTEWEYGLSVVGAIGASTDLKTPNLDIPSSAFSTARSLLSSHGVNDSYVVVHPEVGAFSCARAWPVERFVAVARKLRRETGMEVVLVGTDSARTNEHLAGSGDGVANLAGETSFAELCAIVRDAALVVGCDSSVAHLAGAFERSVVALFGPSNVGAWKPFGAVEFVPGREPPDARAIALHLDLPCSPCLYTGFRLGRPQGCSERTCMMNIDIESTADAARIALSREI